MNWSKYQLAIFHAVEQTSDSLLIEAVAGSGKTSTLVEAIKYVPRDRSVLMCAFNKSIANTLRQRIAQPNASCATLHSLGLRAWQGFVGGGCRVESGKIGKLITWEQRRRWPGLVKLVGLAKQHGVVPHNTQMLTGSFIGPRQSGNDAQPVQGLMGSSESQPARSAGGLVQLSDLPETVAQVRARGLMADVEESWQELCDTYGIDSEEVNFHEARRVLAQSIQMSPQQVDYDDMLYMPIVCGSPFQQYDVVFVDEVQDLNGIQIEMVARMVKGGALCDDAGESPAAKGRVIAVGDPAQSIYRFRGASTEAMATLAERFQCRALPLSISYRCPKSIVAKAKTWVSHIESAPEAPEGVVQVVEGSYEMAQLRQEDVILCRLTRPLVEVAFKLIRNRIPCRVLGRDIGQGLLKLIDKARLKDHERSSMLTVWLDAHEKREVEKLKSKGEWAQIGMLHDRLETLRLFINEDGTVGHVRDEIGSLFHDSDTGRQIRLSTIHKFKGQEAPRVFVLDAGLYMPPEWATDLESERNLCYVACTRAMSELYYITSGGLR